MYPTFLKKAGQKFHLNIVTRISNSFKYREDITELNKK